MLPIIRIPRSSSGFAFRDNVQNIRSSNGFEGFPFIIRYTILSCDALVSGLPEIVKLVSLESAMPCGLFAIPLSLIGADPVSHSLITQKWFPISSHPLHFAGSRGFLVRMLYPVICYLFNKIVK